MSRALAISLCFLPLSAAAAIRFDAPRNSRTSTLPTRTAVADFNGDGIADLAIASPSLTTVLIGRGDGTFDQGEDLSGARTNVVPLAVFAGLPEGSVIRSAGFVQIFGSYAGGSGNDITLTAMEPLGMSRRRTAGRQRSRSHTSDLT